MRVVQASSCISSIGHLQTVALTLSRLSTTKVAKVIDWWTSTPGPRGNPWGFVASNPHFSMRVSKGLHFLLNLFSRFSVIHWCKRSLSGLTVNLSLSPSPDFWNKEEAASSVHSPAIRAIWSRIRVHTSNSGKSQNSTQQQKHRQRLHVGDNADVLNEDNLDKDRRPKTERFGCKFVNLPQSYLLFKCWDVKQRLKQYET